MDRDVMPKSSTEQSLQQRIADLEEEMARLRANGEGPTSREEINHLRRIELLLANSRDIILFIRSTDGRILEANLAALKAYGYTREEILRLTIFDLRAPETNSVVLAQLQEAEARGILFETVHRRKDDSTFPVEVNSQGADLGREHGLISIIRDISERMQT
ncbi:MAG TPA: PAS domain-containing protein, partial [Anaerolineaceae bacterium]|nr:PAS domain-containing protein [Anaerolineaceae bacterium]